MSPYGSPKGRKNYLALKGKATDDNVVKLLTVVKPPVPFRASYTVDNTRGPLRGSTTVS